MKKLKSLIEKINFAIIDWMTSGQLTERKFLIEELRKSRRDLASEAVLNRHAQQQIADLEKQTGELRTENLKIKRVLSEKIGRTDVDRYVSQQQRIFDLEFKLKQYAQLEKRLHAEQRRKMEGVSGAAIGLISDAYKEKKKC